MTDLNSLHLIGRLTKDLGADERSFGYVGNGMARANISIAVNRNKKQSDGSFKDDVSYFDVTIWGKTAENLKPYLTKGKQICVEGFIKQDRWEKDGQKFSKIVIHAENVWLLGGKENSGFDPNTTYPTAQAAQSAYDQQYNQQNGIAQVQQMAGQPVQTRQAQPVTQQQTFDGADFPEDVPF